MSQNPSKEQYILLCIPYRETFEEFLENSQEFLQKAWEKKRLNSNKEKISRDKQENFSFENVIAFKRFWTKWEDTFIDAEMLGPPTCQERVAWALGNEGFFSEESRGTPPRIKERVLDIIEQNRKANRINQTSSNGQIAKLVEQDIQQFWPSTNRSEDLINRYVRLWKIRNKEPFQHYYSISGEEWLFLVKFDKVIVKNSLLNLIVPPLEEQWIVRASSKFPKGRSSTWGDSEGKKLKEQVTSIVYAINHASKERREKFGNLMNKIFKKDNTNEQILKLFKFLLRLAEQPTT